jgi:hypothetical protein
MAETPLESLQARLPKWSSDFLLTVRGWLIFVLSLPSLLGGIISLAKGNLPGILLNGAAFAMYLGAFMLLRRSARTERENRTRLLIRVDRPYRWIAAGVVALTTMALARLGAGQPATVSALFGLGAFLGMYLAYGLEPRSRSRISLPAWEGLERDEALRMLEQAEQRLLGIERSGREIRNIELTGHLNRISSLAKDILTDLSKDPRQIRRSRKFLNVYLDGVEKVVAGYARTHAQVQSEQLDSNFRNVLGAIEQTFSEQRQKLLDDDVFDLDVQMEVLATQLKREGLM